MTKEEAIEYLEDAKIKFKIPKAAVTARKTNEALDIAIKALESKPKVGHWIEEFNDLEGEAKFICSSCKEYQPFETDFCYHCGSDNRGRTIVKES